MASTTPTTFFRDDILALAAWRDIFFEIWLKSGSGPHFRTLRHHLMAFARSHPEQRIAVFTVVQIPSLSNVDKEIREEAAMRAKEIRPHNKASVLVLETKGFAGSLIRGIVTGLALVERSAAPTKIFDAVTPAATWIAPHLEPMDGRSVSGRALLDAFETVTQNTAHVGSLRP